MLCCMLFLLHIRVNSEAFALIDNSWRNFQVFTCSQFLKHLCLCLTSLGIDPSCYTGSLFQHGGVSLAYQAGLSVEANKLLGDWKSDAVKGKLRSQKEFSSNERA